MAGLKWGISRLKGWLLQTVNLLACLRLSDQLLVVRPADEKVLQSESDSWLSTMTLCSKAVSFIIGEPSDILQPAVKVSSHSCSMMTKPT